MKVLKVESTKIGSLVKERIVELQELSESEIVDKDAYFRTLSINLQILDEVSGSKYITFTKVL